MFNLVYTIKFFVSTLCHLRWAMRIHRGVTYYLHLTLGNCVVNDILKARGF